MTEAAPQIDPIAASNGVNREINEIAKSNGKAAGHTNGIIKAVPEEAVDLRSDTVTKPTAAMRRAMAEAEVDDDVLGADPTVDKLQRRVAEIFGKEAGLFVPSGTMGNLISVLVHCEVRGSEVILGADSHIHFYEQGGISTLGGVHPRTVPNLPDGSMDLRLVAAAIRSEDDHYPVTRLVCMENTHNRRGGRAVSVEFTDKLGELAHSHGLQLHIDGARIMNAAVALNVSPARLVRAADTVSPARFDLRLQICLSKGLAAPVGSVIIGTQAFISKARRLRKALGGGMRQVGVLAACGLLSVTEMAARLKEDHTNARILAEGLNAMEGLTVDVAAVDTNIVNVTLDELYAIDADQLCQQLAQAGVLLLTTGKDKMRLVTHYHISEKDVHRALSTFKTVLKETTSGAK